MADVMISLSPEKFEHDPPPASVECMNTLAVAVSDAKVRYSAEAK